MQITPSNLTFLFNQFDLRFQGAYNGEPPIFFDKISTVVPSSSAQNTYPFMAKLPQMRQWLGERTIQNVATYTSTLVNQMFEMTVEVDRNAIEDDTFGVFNPIIDQMGVAAKKWPDYQLVTALQGGQSVTGYYDGQNFFDAAHPVSKYGPIGAGTTQQNYWSSGMALTIENYMTVRKTMMGYLDESGKPVGVRPNLLVVPPALEHVGRMILQTEFYAPSTVGAQGMTGSTTNVMKGTADLIVVPELGGGANDTVWYLLDTSKPIKPFIWQLRQAPQFQQLTSPNDQNVFFRRKYVYGVDSRGAAGYGVWFLAAKASA